MNSEELGPMVLAAVCVLAIVVAAATVTSPTQTGMGSIATGSGDEGGVGDDPGGSGIDIGGSEANESGLFELQRGDSVVVGLLPCLTVLHDVRVVLTIVVGFLAFGYVVKRHYDLIAAVGLSIPLGILLVFSYLLLTTCADDSLTAGLPSSIVGGGSGSPGSVGIGETDVALDPTTVPIAVYALLGIVLLGVLMYAFSDRGGLGGALEPILSRSNDEGSGEPPSVTARTLGQLAGQAAERIEDDDGSTVENEVYRAWREMTRPLAVDRPESSTPAEFATAAVDAGIRRDDVAELTELFADVRYGGYHPTEERERRAVTVLRRIEQQYTDEIEMANDPGGGA